MQAYRDQYAKLFHDGRGIVLLAISVDPVDTLAAWAHDEEFPFLFASDTSGAVGRAYGAHNPKYSVDVRNLYVVGPDGRVVFREVPFREIDPTSYKKLGAALDSLVPLPDSLKN